MAGGIELAPLKTKIEVDIESFQKALDKAEQVGAEAMENISKEAEKLGDKTAEALEDTGEKLANVGKDMEKNLVKPIQKAGEKATKSLEEAGKKISDVGGKLTKSISLPIVGAGTAITKIAIDFEDSFAKVTTLLDENTTDLEAYRKEIVKSSTESGIAVGEFSEAVYGSISAGVESGKAIQFTNEAMKLAKGGFTDGASAVDILTTALNGYKLKTEEATKIADLLITTQNLGKTTVDELASSMGAVIPVASSVNFNIEELSTAYAVLTKNGIATSEAGTYMKSMLSELSKSGSITDKALRKLAGKGFADLKAEGTSTTDILKMLREYAEANGQSLKDMFGSVEAGSAALVLANQDGAEYNEILKAMGESAGATNSAFEKVTDTTGEKLKKAINSLKNSLIEMGDKIAPFIEKAGEIIGKFADKLANLSDDQIEFILQAGLMLAAVGPLLSGVGKGIEIFSTFGGAISKASGLLSGLKGGSAIASTALSTVGTSAAVGAGGLGALGTGLASAAAAAAPFVLGAAAVAGAGYVIYESMTQEVVPAVDLFSDIMVESGKVMTEVGEITTYTSVEISEAAKQAVQSYLNMDQEVQKTLDSMYINSTKVTEETCNQLAGQYKTMGEQIITGLQQDKQKEIQILEEFWQNSYTISKTEKDEIIANTEIAYAEKEKTIQEKTAAINAILEKAKEENRNLTLSEKNEINAIQEEMKETAIKTLSENELEAKTILERMKGYDERITAEQCAEHIKQLNDSRDKAIEAAETEYTKRVQAIIKMRDETKTISKDQADKMIQEAERQRKYTIQKAEDLRIGVINKMRNLNKDLDSTVNTQTGTILTAWDKLKRWWSGWKPETKSFSSTVTTTNYEYYVKGGNGLKASSHYNGLSYVPYDGYNARLHKGERVLTAKENEAYINGQSGDKNSGLSLNIETFINNTESDIRELAKEFEFYRKYYV